MDIAQACPGVRRNRSSGWRSVAKRRPWVPAVCEPPSRARWCVACPMCPVGNQPVTAMEMCRGEEESRERVRGPDKRSPRLERPAVGRPA